MKSKVEVYEVAYLLMFKVLEKLQHWK